jgi:protein-tyrosine phosphatase
MVDIHSHILPALDDGAQDFATSLAMLQMAVNSGTTDIVATPHASPAYRFDAAAVDGRIAELQQTVGSGVRIHRGCDFHLTPENIADACAHPDRYSIDGNGFLLVEFSDSFIPKTIDQIFNGFFQAGLTPVITHPERNRLLQKKPALIRSWRESGALVQITALSLLGGFGRTAKASADELLKRKLVDFVASDAHDCKHRTPVLREAWDYLEHNWGKENAQALLEDNPRACLAGVRPDNSPLEGRPERQSRSNRSWFPF